MGAREILVLSCAVCRYTNGPTRDLLLCGSAALWARATSNLGAGQALVMHWPRWQDVGQHPRVHPHSHEHCTQSIARLTRQRFAAHQVNCNLVSCGHTHTFCFPHTHTPGTGALTQSAHHHAWSRISTGTAGRARGQEGCTFRPLTTTRPPALAGPVAALAQR